MMQFTWDENKRQSNLGKHGFYEETRFVGNTAIASFDQAIF
ncbi:hypothetical protein [Nostoc sp.]